MFSDACTCVNEALLQVAGITDGCLGYTFLVPASVPKFSSQPGLGPDCLAATDLEI